MKEEISIQEIDVSKAYWAFWQKSYCYDYDNGYVCLFNHEIQATTKDGSVVITDNKKAYKHFGHFAIYERFIMNNGKYAIRSKIEFSFWANQPTDEISENDFIANGIAECLNQYFENRK